MTCPFASGFAGVVIFAVERSLWYDGDKACGWSLNDESLIAKAVESIEQG